MKHYDEDTILEYMIETHDDKTASEISDHLTECSDCHYIFERLKSDVEIISSFDLSKEIIEKPIMKRKINAALVIKRAAMILIFSAAAYLAFDSFRQNDINVVGQKLIPRSPSVSITEPFHCVEVDLSSLIK